MADKTYKLSINGSTTNITVMLAHNWLSRLKGLLGTLSLEENNSLWLKPCSSIHTIGMLYSIDVLFLDHQNKVKKMAEQVKPFRCRWGSKYTVSALELSAGAAKKMGIKINDSLNFERQA